MANTGDAWSGLIFPLVIPGRFRTRPYVVTIVRRIRHAIDPNDAVRAAEIGAGDLVDIEVVEDLPAL